MTNRCVLFIVLLLLLPAVAFSQSFYSISLQSGYKYTETSGISGDGSINIGISVLYLSVSPLNLNVMSKGDRSQGKQVGGWEYCLDTKQTEIVDQYKE